VVYPAPSSRRRKRKSVRHVKVTHAPWKNETGACAWTRSENVRELSGVREVAAEGEDEDEVGAVGEVLMMIEADVLEIAAGAVGADAPDPCHDPDPGRLEGVVLLVNPLSVRGVLGLALSVLPEGIVPRDGARGRARDPARPLPVDGSVPFPPRLPVNASPLLVARGVIAVVHLPAEGGTHRMTGPSHVVEALAKGRVGVVGALLLHDAERIAFLDLPPRKVGGVKEVLPIAAATPAVNLRLMQVARALIVVA